ncbi:MAG: hypothetical protein ACREPD_19425 [Stenotrophomonas sp.]|uniref:hypothetical protein n=1 Tax=Stenotrophomonas sp. TaxID=69392 RepID=UPI003D6D5C4E
MAKRQSTTTVVPDKTPTPDPVAQDPSALGVAAQQDAGVGDPASAEQLTAAPQNSAPPRDDLQAGEQLVATAESIGQADSDSANQVTQQMMLADGADVAALANPTPSWLLPTALFEVLTPFKFRGHVVKPPAWIELPIEEAPLYQAAGVLGDEPGELPDDTE